MAKKIQVSQRELVQKADWLDSWGLKNILKHLDDVKVARVGYIDWVREGRGIDEFFKDVSRVYVESDRKLDIIGYIYFFLMFYVVFFRLSFTKENFCAQWRISKFGKRRPIF